MTKIQKSYGLWSSSFSPKTIAGITRLDDVQWSGDTLVWSEGGSLRCQCGSDAPRTITEDGVSARGRVGYGGGAFTVGSDYVYYAGNGGRLYRQLLNGGGASAITPEFGNAAAPAVSAGGEWVAYVHSDAGQDSIGLVDAQGQMWPRQLVSGTDFVMQPTWHPEGDYLAYIAWNHPNMPWDGTELHLAELAKDHAGVPYIQSSRVVAGGEQISIFQPEFSPDGRCLAFVSDETGYGQLYVRDLQNQTQTRLTNAQAEHSTPAWVQGLRMFAWSGDSTSIYFLRNTAGVYTLHRFHVIAGTEEQISGLEDYTKLDQIAVSGHQIAVIGSSSTQTARVLTISPKPRIRARASTENIAQDELASAQPVEWNSADGTTIHGLYYAPISAQFESIGLPPLMVLVHGGPTSQRTAGFDEEVQFYATRGYAVLQVNHRGSTGYGRDYMNMLRGNWGLYDVEDSKTGGECLVQQGLADSSRIIISGGSAGGFTVLQSLVTYPGFYAAGVCKYGISNQFMLVQDTHKFEERYSDSLLGPLPEAAPIYRERSPLFHADRIVDPIIIFQGSEDPVVPKNQSDSIVKILQRRGVTHEYHIYEGEGHGFRKPENVQDYYEKTLQFLMQHVIYA